ncbi:hypothetical protein [Sagittula stellata]|uniref:hypothetical protein n=1 Tax=Sagittula stellata TaxID=52603 RepID=UPI00058B975C|nr:hypothetical protein [Sagittula stellata]
MRHLLPLFACLALAAPVPALADACRDRIAAMFDGGPLDPFARPPHSFVGTTYDAAGNVRWIYEARYETPLKTVGGMQGGQQVLLDGSDSWMGASPDGPWTKAPNLIPDDHEGFIRAQMAQNVKNLDRTDCPGMADVDGTTLEKFVYFTKTDPTPESAGAWFGALNTVFVHPQNGRVMRWETSESVAHYAPDPSGDVQVNVYTYDPAITVSPPR